MGPPFGRPLLALSFQRSASPRTEHGRMRHQTVYSREGALGVAESVPRRAGRRLEMIRRVEERVANGEEPFQPIQGPGRVRLDEPVPDELPRGKVAGVELGELAHVERGPLLRLGPAGDLSTSDGVLAGVLRDHVIRDFEDQGSARPVQETQRAFDVHEAQHLVGLYPGVDVGAPEVWVQGISAAGPVPDIEGVGVEGGEKGEESPPCPRLTGDELLDLEASWGLAVP